MAPDPGKDQIRVEVAYATPARQLIVCIEVPAGCTVQQAIELSGIESRFPDFTLDPQAVGIFSRKVAMNHPLRDGDRVEIYRPLIIDPKEARRKRAEGVSD